MKLLENAKRVFKKQPTTNKILLIIAIIYLISVTFAIFSTIGWWTVFTSVALTYILNMWTELAKEIENKKFDDDKDNDDNDR